MPASDTPLPHHPHAGQTAITIGNFDGVHVGHQSIMRACRRAVGPGGAVIAFAFDPHPASILSPERCPPRLSTIDQRRRWLVAAGASDVRILEPRLELLGLDPAAFVDQVLMPLSPALLLEGEDFHFGKGRKGNLQTLADLGRSRGFRVACAPGVQVALENLHVVRASSSTVRWLIGQGRVQDAAAILSRPYTVEATIVQGDQRGRTIGYPTANLSTTHMLPADGVYAGVMTGPDGRVHMAAINVGNRPTFRGVERRIEVFACTPGGTAAALPMEYGWQTSLSFVHWIREDLRFAGVHELVSQIARDVARCAELMRGSTLADPALNKAFFEHPG
ncbi:MAG TPA: riboflavin kinase [Phycisphaerales bacterium]|nr:riboflavin kinase [Phycisphaerales bacterium]